MTAIRATAVTVAACATVLALVSPSSAINSYNAAPAPERTEVGALVPPGTTTATRPPRTASTGSAPAR
ncbi:hypothetical protein [Streptomyces sp. JB150]|uniref:hypothetical protein n=1 Tax=Streptomyces sp. JB150 TaxID=2714844 RepID=UPI001F0EFB60|nr:hypothetical protein [Streptomyces sp. JB150]